MHKTALQASLVLLALSIGLFVFGKPTIAGPLLTAFFAFSAYGVRGSENLRGFSYSLVIFAAVSLAMNFPAPFVSWGDYQLSGLITPLLQIIMFGMGTQVGVRDFVGVVKDPRGVGIGLVCQFTIMPFVGAALALMFDLEPEVAAGIILIGAAPSGLASNVMAFIARANLALSVSLTTVAALLAPLITPFYMQWLGGELVEVDTWAMFRNIVEMTVVPIVLGALVHHFLRSRMAWLDRIMPLLSIAGIAVILMIMTASGRDNLLQIGLLLIVISLLHNVSGYVLGYWSCRLLGLDERSCRTISFEVGMQNGGLANGLAVAMGKATTVGLVPTVFGSLMNITGATLANYWRDKPPKDGSADAATAADTRTA